MAAFGVGDRLADPRVAVMPLGASFTVASNDDWSGTAALKGAFAASGAFALDAASTDSALMVRLAPGGYTVVVSSANGGVGNAIVEVYDLGP